MVGNQNYTFLDDGGYNMKKLNNIEKIGPNIFDYATKELSQDAFLAWLFKWAEEQYKDEYKDVHDATTKFIQEIINKYNKKFEKTIIIDEIKTVDIYKQTDHIDLWIVINNSLNIVIEDKTYYKQHDNQLETYKQKVEKWCNDKNKDIKQDYVLFYYKLGELEEEETAVCDKYKYYILKIDDLYQNYKNVNHELINNYFTCHYKSDSLDNYDNKSISYFYNYLQTKIKRSGISIRDNEKIFWFNNNDYKEYSMYFSLSVKENSFDIEIRIYNLYKKLLKDKYNKIVSEIEHKQLNLNIELTKEDSFYEEGQFDMKLFSITDKELEETFIRREPNFINYFIERLKKYDALINDIYVSLK